VEVEAAEFLTIAGRQNQITHPDKPYFTQQTKLSKIGIVRYFLPVAPGALRAMSLSIGPATRRK